MTIIAVKKEVDKISIAYDSKITRDNEKVDDSIELDKVIQYEDLYIAVAGATNENILLKEYLAETTIPKTQGLTFVIELMKNYFDFFRRITEDKPESEYIIIKDKRIFFVGADFCNIWEVKDFISIGSGRIYGITALHLGKTPKEAVCIACKLDSYCELPVKEIVIS